MKGKEENEEENEKEKRKIIKPISYEKSVATKSQ